ncbi:nitrous oxide reductase accessory protein NosL [Peribacillus sp. Hz7]|uniref:nitrous oxide reductase accessory protein NosL n=1 Tax=Peribacillus sp. Hz7 TaxID=3344873 RepID=UPI0035CB1A2D
MKKKFFSFLVLIGVLSMLAACGDQEVQPVAINEETDTCATCNMAVADNQYATQVILENGKSLIFDDLGCMYGWLSENKDQKIDAEFVRDYDNKEWVSADDATYVYNQSVKTPMAYNVISFEQKADAEKFVADHAGSTLMTADELAKHSWTQNHEMMQNMGEGHSHSEDGTEESGHDMKQQNTSH